MYCYFEIIHIKEATKDTFFQLKGKKTIMIYGRNLFDQPVKKDKKKIYNNFWEIRNDYGVECTTGCLLGYTYIYTIMLCHGFLIRYYNIQ